MKETIVPVSIVIGVFVFILAVAGVWVYLRTTPHAEDTATATPVGTEQTGAANSATATNNTTATPMENTAAPKYEITKGLEAQDLVEGQGAAVIAGQNVSVKYTGMLQNGTVFDSSDAHGGAPFTFQLGGGQVIKGWDIGVVGMKPGGVRMLTIAPELAYGNQAVGGVIPANATLTFKVEMIGPTQ